MEFPRNKLFLLLVIICMEKFVQHIYVTVAFIYNISDIRTDVVIDYRILLYSGFIVAWLFLFSGISLIRNRYFALNLLWILGLFDFFGEHITQGGFLKFTPISYLIAILIIFLVPKYKRSVLKYIDTEKIHSSP